MSTSSQQDTHDPNSLLYYAPRRLRDRANALRALRPLPGDRAPSAPAAAPKQPSTTESALPENPFPESLRQPPKPEPIEALGLTRRRARRKEGFLVAARFAGVAAVAAGIAFFYVTYFAGSRDRALPTVAGATSASATPDAKKVAMDKLIKKMSAPILAVEDGEANINEPLALGVKVSGHAPPETINLRGLPADTKLTTGTPSGAGEWRVAVNDLPVTAVIPPRDYAGPMNIVAELFGGDGQSVVRRVVRLAWRQTTSGSGSAASLQGPAATGSPATGAAAPLPARQIDPSEVASLMKRGEELASNGDIPAARLLLQRAAEARNARAAFALAATYDPAMIKQFGRNSATPDLALARTWYQRASDWGSSEAPKQLEALASVDR